MLVLLVVFLALNLALFVWHTYRRDHHYMVLNGLVSIILLITAVRVFLLTR